MPYYPHVRENTEPIENMSTYYITTDSSSQEIEADTLAEALKEWGEAPTKVTDVDSFEEWLEKAGGYGSIQEDGVQIASVKS